MFCYPEHIASSIDQLFKKLALAAFKPGATTADFLDAATDSTQHHNLIELFTTTCVWQDNQLTIYEPSQFVYLCAPASARRR